MAKITHKVDASTGKIIRETKLGNKITTEEISQDQLDNYEASSGVFGCIGGIVGLGVFIWILRNIFGG